MIDIAYNPNDPRYIFLQGPADMMNKVESHLNPYIPFSLLPTSKIPPTREIFLDRFQRNGRWIYWCAAGLWKEIQDFCELSHLPVQSGIDDTFKYTPFHLSKSEFKEMVMGWNLNITPRDYQIEAAWLILKYRLSLSELATRAGKTLIFYMVTRAAKELLGVRNILMIVPSIHLVKQGVKDLQEYQEYFEAEQIWAGGEEVSTADLTIGTFQSLIRRADARYQQYNPDFFNKFDMVCVDEAHKSPCKSIKKILSLPAFRNMVLRFGFTGTLPKPGTIEWMACQAMLGPKIQEITARELIEGGYLADPIIYQHQLLYDPNSLKDIQIECAEYILSSYRKDTSGNRIPLPKDARDVMRKYDKVLPTAIRQAKGNPGSSEKYIDFLIRSCKDSSKTLLLEQYMAMFSRNKINLIKDIIRDIHGNVIVFAHNTDYISMLTKELQGEFPGRTVYKVSGQTSLKRRQEYIDSLTKEDNIILVASFGVFGTGLTIRNVDHGIFAQSFKADTITRQSLGRLMLRSEGKTKFYMYDIIDGFPTKSLLGQGRVKIKIYDHEGHTNTVVKHKMKFQRI